MKQKNQESRKHRTKYYFSCSHHLPPHVTEELWREVLKKTSSIHLADWPTYDELLAKDDTVVLGVQINGKVRAEIEVRLDESEDSVREKILGMPQVKEMA